ncbi:MAG TPA: hypothetical protein VMR98_03360, partial [Candidatus Polarisedimenticolaceae bacterium]|nr:hypothetical protein [Candidatus Polarisedimenticolaceae bacterium]
AAGDDATSMDLSADPNSDEMAFSSIGNAGADLQAAYWSGSAWTFYANQDITAETPTAGTRLTQTGWVTNNGITKWIVTYDDASGTALSWYAASPGSAPVAQTDFVTSPTINDVRERYQIDNNPFKDSELLLTISDSTKKVVAERLTMGSAGALAWADASPGAGAATINTIPAEGFSFQYNRYAPPGSLSLDIVDTGGSSVTSPAFSMSALIASFRCDTSTGTLGTSAQRVRIQNTTNNAPWSVSVAATAGNAALWSSGGASYDFNDRSGSPLGCSAGGDSDVYAGSLSLATGGAALAAQSGCANTGVSLGGGSAFNEGTVDTITLATADANAAVDCYWDITGILATQ